MDSKRSQLYMRYALRCTVVAEIIFATLMFIAVGVFFFRQELFAPDFPRNVRAALFVSATTTVFSMLHIALRKANGAT